MRALALLLSALALIGPSALAHTAYMTSSTFTPSDQETVTLEVSFTDYCCEPEVAVRSDNYQIVQPDGTSTSIDRIETFKTMTVLEHAFSGEGTWRVTTGERLGRKGQYARVDGRYVSATGEDGEPVEFPSGTPFLSSQTATVSDVYLTSGAPTWDAVKAPIGRLSIIPITHPAEAIVGNDFSICIEFDGHPVANQTITLTKEGQRYREGDIGLSTQTNEQGLARLTLTELGIHVAMVRLQAPAPEGAETDIRSYTTALTFDVPIRD